MRGVVESPDYTGKIRVGISACLLGERVRYDGGHKLDPFLRDTFGEHVEFVPVCPEVECGMPVPREPLRLSGAPDAPRIVTRRDGIDHTGRMLRWARRRVARLAAGDPCAFILKGRSPSCGVRGVGVRGADGVSRRRGTGLFARLVMERFPLLPVEEEGRLHDPALRDDFIERMFTVRRWRTELARGRSRRALARFHARQQFLLLARSPTHLREMGRLLEGAVDLTARALFDRYATLFAGALGRKATPVRNTRVLLRAADRLGPALDAHDREEILETIEHYRAGRVPLLVPITLLRHFARTRGRPDLEEQAWLNPHPVELMLRNHA